ncbi:MAG: alpha/beta hydrolase [Sphingomonadales bacterium]|nr:alpha/beta hydrolase [Sphingomonadales bacterium]
MLDPDIAALLGPAAPPPALSPDSIADMRAGMRAMGGALTGAKLPVVQDHSADGVAVRLYRPSAAHDLPLLVFLHGGGWFLGDLDTHDAMHRQLARQAGCAVLAVAYRLAPEHRFPAGLDDALAALRWARREAARLGCDVARIALGGESAGANLAAAVTLRLRTAGEAQPLFQLLVHPVTDMRFALPSIGAVAAPGLERRYLEACRALYLGAADPDDPLVSPLRAGSHAGLAPAIVLTAEEDPLRDDGEFYAAALVRAGVETLACRLPSLPHGFLFLPVAIPAVANAYACIARLILRHFSRDSGALLDNG